MQGELIAALDLGSGGATVAVGAMDAEGRLEIKEVAWLPMAGVVRGEIANRQQVSAAVREAIAAVEGRLGVRVSELYTGAAGRGVRWATHDYSLTSGSPDGDIRAEEAAAVKEAMNGAAAPDDTRILERVPQRWKVDGREAADPVGAFGRRLDATFGMVMASETLLDRMEKILTALGVRSRGTFAAAVASARAVVLPDEREMGVAVVDMGAGTTDVCVVADGAVRFVRSIPFGSRDIDSDIQQQGILEKHVEDLKTTYGLAMASQVHADKLIKIPGRTPRESQEISQRNLATIVEHRLREIVAFVGEEIAESGYAGKLRGGIVLTGGGSQLAGVDEVFREMLGMDVRLALPDVRVAEGSQGVAQNPARATVIGLLLMGAGGGGGGVSAGARRPIIRQAQEPEQTPEPVETRSDTDFDDPEPAPKPRKEKGPGWFRRKLDDIFSGPLDDEDI